MARKSLRDLFEDSYTAIQVPANNAKGYRMKYVYYAPWYYWDVPGQQLLLEKWTILGSSVFSLVLYLIISLQNTEINYVWYVFAPAALALCCHILEIYGLIQFAASKNPTTRMTYEEVNRIMELAPVGRGMVSALAGAAGLLHVLIATFSMEAILVSVGYLICAGLAWFEVKRFSKIPYRTEKNTTLEQLVSLEEAPKED